MKKILTLLVLGLFLLFPPRGARAQVKIREGITLEGFLTASMTAFQESFREAVKTVKKILGPAKGFWKKSLGERVRKFLSRIGDYFRKQYQYRRSIFWTEFRKEKRELKRDLIKLWP